MITHQVTIRTSTQNSVGGVAHIESTFAARRLEGRAALIPYLPLGYPTPELSVELILAAAAEGADLIELGVPFSDPVADGPTVQRATQAALQQGMTVARCLEIAAEARVRGVTTPLLFMGYYNPFLAYGLAWLVTQSRAAGLDGFIVPDLPPEEAAEFSAACVDNNLALVYLLAPNSSPERIRLIARASSGFLYLVSVTGITGARDRLPAHLSAFVARVRAATDLPLAVGFGISTPEQVRQVGEVADGVVVGSALIERIGAAADPAAATREFIARLRDSA